MSKMLITAWNRSNHSNSHKNHDNLDLSEPSLQATGYRTKYQRPIPFRNHTSATASHSEDSISVVLDSGECMVGDLEPIEYLVAYEENIALQNDWKLVMSYHPKVIYYAHANEKHFV